MWYNTFELTIICLETEREETVRTDIQNALHQYLEQTIAARDAAELKRALNACVGRLWPGACADLLRQDPQFAQCSSPCTAGGITLATSRPAHAPMKHDASREEWTFPVLKDGKTVAVLSIFAKSSLDSDARGQLEECGTRLAEYLGRQYIQMNRAYPQQTLARLADEVCEPLTTTLTAIQLTSEKLRRNEEKYETEYKQTLDAAERSVYRSFRLARNITDAERLEAGLVTAHPVCCDLAPLLESIVDALVPIAEARGVALECNCGGGPYTALCDPYLFERILFALLSNALYAAPETTGKVKAELGGNGERVHVCVTDNGPGLPEADRARVFDKYWRGEAPAAGRVGLGLYLAAQFAELQSGALTADGLARGASCFRLTLPAAEPELELHRRDPMLRNNLLRQLVNIEFA